MMMATLLLLAGCTDDTTTEDSGLPPGIFAASITSHADGDTLLEGYRVGLAGMVNDPDGVNSDVNVTWHVGGDEACPETSAADDGSTSCDVTFDENQTGEQVVVLEALAPDGETTQATVTVEVLETQAPTATIAEPADDSSVTNDPGVYMSGTVGDSEDAANLLLYTWSSSRQGPLVGSTAPATDGHAEALVVLEAGTHVLTLDVIDTTGKSGKDSVTVTVE